MKTHEMFTFKTSFSSQQLFTPKDLSMCEQVDKCLQRVSKQLSGIKINKTKLKRVLKQLSGIKNSYLLANKSTTFRCPQTMIFSVLNENEDFFIFSIGQNLESGSR